MKNSRKVIISSFIMIIACCLLFAGTTFAWFSDSVSSNNNVITAGNLDVEVEYTLDGETWADLQGAEDLFQKSLWEPGHKEVVALKVTNKGSLALKYEAKLNVVQENAGKNKKGEDILLSEYLVASSVTQQADQIGDILVSLAFRNRNANNLDLEGVPFKELELLGHGELAETDAAHYIVVAVEMPSSVGNEANHDGVNVPSIAFGIEVVATQFNHESDSFGSDYDKDAQAPAANLPKAQVTKVTERSFVSIDGVNNGEEVQLDTQYVFASPLEETAETVAVSEYKDYHVDFVVKVNRDLIEDCIALAGAYGAYEDGLWVAFTNGDFLLEAGEEFRLLESIGEGTYDFPYMTYETLVTLVQEFCCGAVAIGDYLVGAEITVELRLYETVDNGSGNGQFFPETGDYVVAGTYSHIFE